MTSRPWSAAHRAVIRDPLRSVASTTTTAADNPLIIRLRRGKWKLSGGGRGSHLAYQSALRGDPAGQLGVLPWIDDIYPATQDGRRARRALETAPVGRAINAPGQTAYDCDAATGQFGSQTLGNLAGIRRTRARTYQSHRERIEQTTPARDPQDRWRVWNRRQTTRIVATAEGDGAEAALLRLLQPALRIPPGNAELPPQVG